MNSEKTLHLVPETKSISPKPKSKKEMLIEFSQELARQNAENINKMFEILKMKED